VRPAEKLHHAITADKMRGGPAHPCPGQAINPLLPVAAGLPGGLMPNRICG